MQSMYGMKTMSVFNQHATRHWHAKREGFSTSSIFMQGRWRKPPIVSRPLRVGFVPLCDCAPLVMAQELGLFAKHGLRVELSREIGWATVRDKSIYRQLDAAHSLAPRGVAT